MMAIYILFRVCLLLSLLFVTCEAASRQSTCYRSLKSPLPSGLRCGSYGTVSSPQLLRQATTLLETVANCRDECMDDVTCLSFSISYSQQLCRIYKGSLSAMGFKAGSASGGTGFYERGCYQTDCDTYVDSGDLTDGTSTWDDNQLRIDLPFPLKMYGKSTTTIWMSVNGVLSFTQPTSTIANNVDLPSSSLPDVSICVFWRDLIRQSSSQIVDQYEDQELRWEYRNDFGRRIVRFYWKVRYPYSNPTNYLDVQVFWNADQNGPAILTYSAVGPDEGSGATIGSQCNSCGKYNQFRGPVKRYTNVLYNSTNGVWYNPF